MFAEAEVELETPRAKKLMRPYLEGRIFDALSPEELDIVSEELARCYSGKEKVGKLLKTKVFEKFYQEIGKLGVNIEADDTIYQAALKIYIFARKKKIGKIIQELKKWEINKEDLFPEVKQL